MGPVGLLAIGRDLAAARQPKLAAFYADRVSRRLGDPALPTSALGEARGVILDAAMAVLDDDPAVAADLLRRLLVELPDDSAALLALSDALLLLGTAEATAEAAAVFDTALMTLPRPTSPEGWLVLGDTLFRLGRWVEAIPCLRRALGDGAGEPTVRFRLGLALIRAGSAPEGVPLVESAIRDLPGGASEEFALAQALESAGLGAEAAVHLRRYVELAPEPRTPSDHALLAAVLTRLGQRDEAFPHLVRAAAGDALDAKARWNLGATLLQRGREDEAIEHLSIAIDELEPDAARQYLLGVALARSGRMVDAVPHLRRAVELEPANAVYLSGAALALERIGASREAVTFYERALRTAPGDVKMLATLAQAQQGARLFGDAIASYRALLGLKPDDEIATFRLAWLLASAPDPADRDGAEAVRHAQALCEDAGREATLMDLLAAAYAEAGQLDEAIETALEAIEIAESKSRPDLVAQVEARLRLYRAGRPYRFDP
jgi:tetratricopeptide (TPR) repeat protein